MLKGFRVSVPNLLLSLYHWEVLFTACVIFLLGRHFFNDDHVLFTQIPFNPQVLKQDCLYGASRCAQLPCPITTVGNW